MGGGEKLPGHSLDQLLAVRSTANSRDCTNIGSATQKGIVTYALSANRQRPLAGVLNAAVFNTWRRFRHQVMYFAPPLILAYVAMDWAIER
ncbi:MAG: hypothetical protein M1816_003993 [Peltula sp. TS41687]|nr:MAG: hypothetical protein M1816_003993 [Peltula sp. TS41687]